MLNGALNSYSSNERIIAALDMDDLESIKKVVETYEDKITFYKVGLQSFLLTQGKVLEYLESLNKKIFLDLKFYDIPATLKLATLFPIKKSVEFFTVHASIGHTGLSGIAQMLEKENNAPLALAVTVLTSFSQQEFQETYQTSLSLQDSVIHLAKTAYQAGIKGLVCSAQEAGLIKKEVSQDLITVCPGIRLSSDNHHDQMRVCTPYEAIKNGADFLVIGRSLSHSKNTSETITMIQEEIEKGFYERQKQS